MKRIARVSICLVVVLTMMLNNIGIIFAESTKDECQSAIKAEMIQIPPIDIALSVGSSKLDLSNFEQDIKNELASRNMYIEQINLKTFDNINISSESQDAYKIFTSWTSFPFNSPIYWRYDQSNRWITTSYNEAYETGFLDETSGYVRDFTMKATVQGPETIQPLGFVFRAKPSEKYPGKWDMYYFWVSADGYCSPNEKVFAIFKVEGQNLDAATRPNWSGTYSATPLCRYNKNYFGWPYHTPYDYGGYPHGTSVKVGTTVTNKCDTNMKTTTLAVGSIPDIYGSGWYELELKVKGGQYVAKVNGNEILNVTDEEPYLEGYYGIFSYSHVNPKFKEILIEKQKYKTLYESIVGTEWADDALHFVINLNEESEASLTNKVTYNELLKETLAHDIHYIGWGSAAYKSESQSFIQSNQENGTFIDSSDYESSIKQIVDYIVLRTIYTEGSGSEAYPYKIHSIGQLFSMKYHPEAYYELTESVDLQGSVWQPIGMSSSQAFTGHFDGKGNSISNFTIEGGTSDGIGLFGYTSGATIKNVTLDSFNISGRDYVGALIGRGIGNKQVIENCYIGEGKINGRNYVGGLIGRIDLGNITSCESMAEVEGQTYIGGLAGYLYGLIIKDCITYATVTGVQDVGGLIGYSKSNLVYNCMGVATVVGGENVGGLIGHTSGLKIDAISFSPRIDSCESLGNIKGNDRVGGLIGYATYDRIMDCSATDTLEGNEMIGGLVGVSESSQLEGCSSQVVLEGSGITDLLVGCEL